MQMLFVANALRTEKPSRFKLLGFIDKFNNSKTGKSILNLPILNQNKSIHVILRAMKLCINNCRKKFK